MKRSRLPLTALRSFEAAGRLSSMTQAANELCVSQAAVSRQIRELETLLGTELFERRHRQVILTDSGRHLLERLTPSFDAIATALDSVAIEKGESALVVSAEPSFAACWLLPHLDEFRARHPGITVLVDADPALIEFRGHAAEIAIRYGASTATWPRVQSRRLAQAAMSPVLSPRLLSTLEPLDTPAALTKARLLHETNRDGWPAWFRAAGATVGAARDGPLFADVSLAIQAALLGYGIALADDLLVEDDVATGRLVRPFETRIVQGAYYVVAPDFDVLKGPAAAFLNWIWTTLSDPAEAR